MTVEELEAVVGAVLEDRREVAFGPQQPVTLFRAEKNKREFNTDSSSAVNFPNFPCIVSAF